MANQNDAVMLFVQDLAKTLQADPNEVIQIAQLNPEALKSAVEVFQQTQDIQQAAQAFQLSLQQLVQAAKHGAKLQYLKSLKNKCAEDEELYYFKKGGSIGCGCKKKEEGGKVTKTSEKNSSIERFKNRPRTKEEQAKIDKLSELDYLSYKSKVSESNDERTPQQKALKMKVEKKSKGSKMKLLERGSKCPKCGKVHSAGMGCSVAGFKKKFEKGGLLKFLGGSTLPNIVITGTNKSRKSSQQLLQELMRDELKAAGYMHDMKPQVLRADRSAEGTARPTSTYAKYKTFKEAYNAARKNKDMYFDFKGKVYRSYDNPNQPPAGFNDNKAEMMARYGKYLGWRKDPNMGNKSVKHTTDIKNKSLGDTNILELAQINPAEPVEYNNNNLAKWLLFENWKPEDYETLANKTAAAGAGVAATLGGAMLAGPAMTYVTTKAMPWIGRQMVTRGYTGPGSGSFSRMFSGNANPVNGGHAVLNWYWGSRGTTAPVEILSPLFKRGGSLKRIPFYQQGKTLPVAPKAEDRFRNGIKKSYRTKDYMNREYETKSVVGERSNLLKTPAVITRTVRYSNVSPEYNDTIYNETPERLIMRGARSRGASRTLTPFIGTMYGDGYMMDLNKNNASKSEYETLKRRFNTAWSLAK